MKNFVRPYGFVGPRSWAEGWNRLDRNRKIGKTIPQRAGRLLPIEREIHRSMVVAIVDHASYSAASRSPSATCSFELPIPGRLPHTTFCGQSSSGNVQLR